MRERGGKEKMSAYATEEGFQQSGHWAPYGVFLERASGIRGVKRLGKAFERGDL